MTTVTITVTDQETGNTDWSRTASGIPDVMAQDNNGSAGLDATVRFLNQVKANDPALLDQSQFSRGWYGPQPVEW